MVTESANHVKRSNRVHLAWRVSHVGRGPQPPNITAVLILLEEISLLAKEGAKAACLGSAAKFPF